MVFVLLGGFSLVRFLKGVLIGVRRAAGTEGDDNVPLSVGNGILKRRSFRAAVSGLEAKRKRIAGIVERPFPIAVHDKRHQAIDGIAAVCKMDPEFREIEPGSKV